VVREGGEDRRWWRSKPCFRPAAAGCTGREAAANARVRQERGRQASLRGRAITHLLLTWLGSALIPTLTRVIGVGVALGVTFSFFESKPSARSATCSSLVSMVPDPSVSKRSKASRSSCICHSGIPGRAVTGARDAALLGVG